MSFRCAGSRATFIGVLLYAFGAAANTAVNASRKRSCSGLTDGTVFSTGTHGCGAADLHGFLAKIQSQCVHKRRAQLKDCVNLAPPGSGSRTLSFLLSQYSFHAHHDHTYSLDKLRAGQHINKIWVNNSFKPLEVNAINTSRWQGVALSARPAPPSCFIMPIRDPVDRMESGFGRRDDGNGTALRFGLTTTVRGWREIARSQPARWHSMLEARPSTPNRAGTPSLFGMQKTYVFGGEADFAFPMNGSAAANHMDSQLAYLASAKCDGPLGSRSNDEIHILCTDRLIDDWERMLVNEFHLSSKEATARAEQFAASRRNYDEAAFHDDQRHSLLDEKTRQWLRYTLFAEDAVLYEFFCGRSLNASTTVLQATGAVAKQGR